jgi:hypothetical protein
MLLGPYRPTLVGAALLLFLSGCAPPRQPLPEQVPEPAPAPESVVSPSAFGQSRDRNRVEAQAKVLRAISNDDGVEISNLFRGNSGDLIKADDDLGGGRGYLHVAAAQCKAKAADALLKAGANPNFTPRSGNESVLSIAARQCATGPASVGEALLTSLFSAGADPNPIHIGAETRKPEPEFFKFALLCTTPAQFLPSYLAVLDRWIRGGLKANASSSLEAGKITALHFWAGNVRQPLCVSAIERLADSAQVSDFAIADNKGRLPIDYTLGPAFFSQADNSYQIFCFAYQDPRESGLKGALNGVRALYISKGNKVPDVVRACAGQDGDALHPVIKLGADKNGKAFLIEEVRLAHITDPATTDSPDCASPPGGWSRCQLLRLESIANAFSLSTNPKVETWFKEADQSCPNSFDPARHSSPADAGYRQCDGVCGQGWASLTGRVDPVSASGASYPFVERLAKNWSHILDRCYAITVHLGPP